MLAQVRKVGWSRLELVNGSLEYSLADLRLRLASPRLHDGEWHHASVQWMLGEVWLNLDYGQHELTKQSAVGIQVREGSTRDITLLLNSIFSAFYYRPRTIGSVATIISTLLKLRLNLKLTNMEI